MAHRLEVAALIASAAFLAGCGNNPEKPPPTPTSIPSASVTKEVIPTATATAVPRVIITPQATFEPRKPLTEQERTAASAQMEQTRKIIDEFMPRPLIQKYSSTALQDLPPTNDKNYQLAVTDLFNYSSVDGSARTVYNFRTGPDGILHYQMILPNPGENTTIITVVNLFDPLRHTNVGDFTPEISSLYGSGTIKDLKGDDIKLPFRESGLPDLARVLFNLPSDLSLRQTSSKLEGGLTIPAVEGRFNSPQGSVTVNVNAFGMAGMLITR